MKKLVVLICVIILSSFSYSQNKISAGLGYDVALPMGDFLDVAKTGHSWNLFGEYRLNPKYSVQLISGYTIFPANIEDIGYQGQVINFTIKSIPLKGAVKYFFYDEFFALGEVGVNFINLTANFQNAYGDESDESSDFQTKFTAGAGIGFAFKLSEQSLINITTKYNYVNGGDASIDFSHILLGASLVIHFGI
jgi:opacity protein-like surface antigen